MSAASSSDQPVPPVAHHFANLRGVVGLAVSQGRVIATRQCSHDVVAIDGTGVQTMLLTLPDVKACRERYLAVSPGLGGFTAGDIFITAGREVYEVSPDGSSVALFVTVDKGKDSGMGITFDTVGTFDNDMILTSHEGQLYKVTSAGVATPIVDLAVQTEGPTVAPLTFTPYGGDILLGDKDRDVVMAIAPDGTETDVTAYNNAEWVIPVPDAMCTTGTNGAAFFVALHNDNEIKYFRNTDFTFFTDQFMVGSEDRATIGRFWSSFSGIKLKDFSGPIGTAGDESLEGAAFCT
jgi:hypothetical protein